MSIGLLQAGNPQLLLLLLPKDAQGYLQDCREQEEEHEEHGVDMVVGVMQIVTVWTVLSVVHCNRQDSSVGTLRTRVGRSLLVIIRIYIEGFMIIIYADPGLSPNVYVCLNLSMAWRCMYCLMILKYCWRKKKISNIFGIQFVRS